MLISRQLCRASQDSGRDRVTSRPKRLDADFISQFLAPLRDQASAISSISTSNPLNQRLSGDHTARVSPEALTHPEESEMLELSGHKRARPMIGKHAEFIVELVKFAEMQVEAAAAAEVRRMPWLGLEAVTLSILLVFWGSGRGPEARNGTGRAGKRPIARVIHGIILYDHKDCSREARIGNGNSDEIAHVVVWDRHMKVLTYASICPEFFVLSLRQWKRNRQPCQISLPGP